MACIELWSGRRHDTLALRRVWHTADGGADARYYVWPKECTLKDAHDKGCHIPILALPKKRPALVDDDGGGGFWICDAVGARDWRMLYVRCILVVYRWSEGGG